MKKYNNLENPEFTQEIDIFEVTDPAHADVLNIPVKQIYENTIVNQQTKVDKEEGKSLSDHNYSDEEKNKLAAIEAGAQKNTVLGVKGNAEVEYKTGNVNLTPGNIGAAAKNHLHQEYAVVSHEHDYAPKNHTHSNYATTSHNHDNAYAAKNHTHSNYATTSHNHDNAYAAKDHTHSNYATTSHNHDNKYATINHNHDSAYASKTHTHSPIAMGVRSGTTVPASSLGNNGDIYFQYIL